MKKVGVLLLCTLFFLVQPTSSTTPSSCTVKLPAEGGNVEAVVGGCRNTGSFSLGGLYAGGWERLTYFYPRPWAGTFITVNVDGKLYTTSQHPRDGVLMDEYKTSGPQLSGDLLTIKWTLPENIEVEQTLQHKTNSTFIKVKAVNHASKDAKVGVRMHLDTLIGVNDGAPIYVPGDGLKTNEESYTGSRLSFKYWKAYNHPTEPTIVATGMLDPSLGLTYPDKLVIADWKKSKDTAWDYTIDSSRSILGDSAVLIYYNPQTIPPEGSVTAVTGYGASEPILPQEKGFFGITEVMADNVYGLYCPGNASTITVDVLSVNTSNTGTILLEILEDGKIVYTKTKTTGEVKQEEIKSVGFKWILPETKKDVKYTLKATLKNQSDDAVDEKTKENAVTVKLSECVIPEKEEKSYMWFILPLLLAAAALATLLILLIYYNKKRKVEIEKTVDEDGTVKVRVRNNLPRRITECVVSDRIPTQAEVDVKTLHVVRKDNKLVWNIGELAAGAEAVLEYGIRGVSVLPPARVSWDSGEAVTD